MTFAIASRPGRTTFPTLRDVVNHYADLLTLSLTDQEKLNLIEYLKSL